MRGWGCAGERGRGALVGTAALMLGWIADTRRPFTAGELARGCELGYRTALRWLEALEASRLVRAEAPPAGRRGKAWSSRVRVQP